MAEQRKADGMITVAAGMSTAAAIAAGLALLAAMKRAEAAPPGEVPEIPQELVQLIIAIAASADAVDDNTRAIIAAIKALSFEGALGWPPNVNSGTALRIAIATTGTRMPYIAVPSGMALVIKAWPLNPGWLQVGFSLAECTNVNQSYPLLPNESVGYFIQNADEVYIAATVAGCFACLTVEQRKGGGG